MFCLLHLKWGGGDLFGGAWGGTFFVSLICVLVLFEIHFPRLLAFIGGQLFFYFLREMAF